MADKKKLFVVSDIHGHGTLLKKVLDEAGFDDNNEDHLFVFCGDLFDRGRENRKVYDFVRKLKHKVLVRGNHDERLADALKQKCVDMYDLYNGMEVTLTEFFGPECVGPTGELHLPPRGKMAGKLCRLVEEMCDYYETAHYVFVHGWLPTQPNVCPPQLIEDWRNADERAWHAARFSKWLLLYGTDAMLPGKTIVCGHRPTRLANTVDPSRSPTDSSIFYGDGMIAIDAGTIRSGRVNLLVLEDETLDLPETDCSTCV